MPSPKSADAEFAAALAPLFQQFFPEAGDEAREKLLRHYRLLTQWNRRLNLTRVIEPAEAARKHFGESLFLARSLPREAQTVVDVGSGAGFPGLPLAAVRGDLSVTCVESVAKKAAFLSEVARDWPNVRVVNRRIEDVSDRFDWAVIRAVAIEPLLGKMAQIASKLAILGAEDLQETLESASGWAIMAAEPLPWPKSGIMFHVEHRPGT